MDSSLASIHDDLRAVARDLLTKNSGRASGSEAVPVDWSLLAASGWPGLEVPEALDGGGATFEEVAVILHEMGRSVSSSSYLGSAVLGVAALNLLEPGPVRDEHLRGVATGALRVALAVPTGDTDVLRPHSPFWLDGAGCLQGEAGFIPDAADADRILVAATDQNAELVLVDLERSGSDLEVSEQPVLDSTRRLAFVRANGVGVPENSILRFRAEAGEALASLLDRGAVATACDSLGVAEAMMETTVAYAGVRRQFDRPIGSFQAVKHACADMLVQVKVCQELLAAAVRSHAGNHTDSDVAVSMAKSYVCEAAVQVVGKAMQLHGGIGYTWESGIPAYLKRAVLNRSLFGSPASHRRRLARRYSTGFMGKNEG
jgi:alkylation response protein AidB-like acyl-CoA dehydrogenase